MIGTRKFMATLQQGNSRVSNDNQTNVGLQGSEPERNQASALGVAISREEKGTDRVIVRFTGFRCRPLDPDNFAAGVKDSLDALRYAHLIDGDEPWRITLQTEQVKVAHRNQEKTIIELEYPNG